MTIESTSKIVEVNGVPCRMWEGESEHGIPCHCFITRVAVDKDEPKAEEFKIDLQEHKPPSAALYVYPLRMII